MNLQIGQVSQFKYHSGTNPGSTRLAFITSKRGHAYVGYDFDADGMRTFAPYYIDELVESIETKQIDVSDFPPSALTYLRQEYERQGKTTFVDTNENMLHVFKREVDKPRFYFDDIGVDGSFRIYDRKLHTSLLVGTSVLKKYVSCGYKFMETPEQLLQKLQEFLNSD